MESREAGGHQLEGGLRRLVLFLVCLFVAAALGHFGVYQGLIVPRLPEWRHVPLGMWMLHFAPESAVCIATGVSLRRWKQVAAYAFAAACVKLVFEVVWGPPRHDGWDAFSVTGVGLVFSVCYGLLLAIAAGVGQFAGRPRAVEGGSDT